MNTLVLSKVQNFAIDWGVILLACGGQHNLYISPSTVKDFANQELEQIAANDALLDIVVWLAGYADQAAPIELREAVYAICDAREINLDLSKRKWRCILLEELLAFPANDPMERWMDLADFWRQWRDSLDAPVSSLAKNVVSECDFFEASYALAAEESRRWLATELVLIQKPE